MVPAAEEDALALALDGALRTSLFPCFPDLFIWCKAREQRATQANRGPAKRRDPRVIQGFALHFQQVEVKETVRKFIGV